MESTLSLFLKALSEIRYLKEKADCHGNMRMSITFDNPSDKAKFELELKRDLGNIVDYYMSHHINAGIIHVYGIEVRVL